MRIGRPAKYDLNRPKHVVIKNPMEKHAINKNIIFTGKYSADKIKVSVFLTGRRDSLWKELYESLANNNSINFEFVLSASVYPKFKLPKNFKFIYSVTKPIQSLYLAMLNCSGETILNIADDCRCSPHFIDNLYEMYKKDGNYKNVIIPNFLENVGGIKTDEELTEISNSIDVKSNPILKMIVNNKFSPPAHVGGLMSNRFTKEVGPFDNRFVMRYGDLDLQMRAFNSGAIYKYCQNAWIIERGDIPHDTTVAGGQDWGTFLQMWFAGSNHRMESLLKNRFDKICPFIDDGTLHVKNQGRKDVWD